ncbi:MAG TPA: PKD domain-containing protein [Cyclobacteriaceae bacterium]
MKKLHLIYAILITLILFVSSARAQQTFHTTLPGVIGYLQYLPQDYDTNSDKYPVVFFLHGLGEVGAASKDPAVIEASIGLVSKNGPPKLVNNGTQFPFILISPQLKSNYTDWPVAYVNEVINYCKTYLRIDESRIYLTGLSLGGGGTWSTAQDFPQTFAAIAPVCGSRNNHAKACNIAGENLPVWAFHGDADTVVPYLRTTAQIDAINACTPTPNPLAKVTIYPGVGHNCWDNAYRNDHTLHNPNVYEWMLSYKNTINGTNTRPVANAGSDIIRALADNTTAIRGAGTDSNGTIVSYAWSQIAGPSTSTLTNSSTSTLTVSNMILGEYVYQLKVTDDAGDTDTDYVKVTVQTVVNKAPVATAGVDMTISLPTNAVTVVGSGTDADGTIASYQWTEVSGSTTATLSGTTTTKLSATSLAAGSYVFRLTVTDNKGASSSDDMTVTVNSTANIPPVANAGPDKTILLPTNSGTLFGSATDADGTIATYKWKQISGASCTISSTSVSRPKISNLVSGTYAFQLTVTDNNGASSSDSVNVLVDAPPIVDAGVNYTVTLPTNSITLTGTATDSDGTVSTYLWSKYSGPTVTLTNKNTPAVLVTKLLEGTYIFKLTVTDNVGVQSVDYDTVTVLPAVTTTIARTSTSDVVTEVESTDQSGTTTASTGFNLATLETTAQVVVYNEQGEKLFEGMWNKDLYTSVFSRSGLYIYHIVEQGKKSSGKVYITRS